MFRVHRLRHPVGIEKEVIARRQLQFLFVVAGIVDCSQYHIACGRYFGNGTVLFHQDRRVVTRIAIGDYARMDIQDSVEYGHEHVIHTFLAEDVVGTLHTHRSRVFGQRDSPYHRPADRHEDGGGNAFARYVGNDEA